MSASPVSMETAAPSFLATRQGKLTLAFLCAVGFLDFVGAAIVNVALPAIRADLHFSVQNLQWVLSGYLITYGGFMLLGGRAADLLGRRRVLVAGIVVFGVTSLVGGLATNAATLVGARLAQGLGAAMMLPAALSILTTTFSTPSDRYKALGAWGAMAGLSSAVGVFFGGLLTEGPGWRWVLLINIPVCVVVFFAAFRLVDADTRGASLKNFDFLGAVLGTVGMLLLVYALVKAPVDGWGTSRTIGELATSGVLLAAFLFNEHRNRNPLVPLSIFRIRGLAAANAAQVIAMASFYSMFFFLTLYMQDVLGYSEIKGGSAYLPVTFGVAISSGIASTLFSRIGTRPIIVAGAALASGAVFWLSRIPVHGSYLTNLLPPLMIMSFGLGAVFVGVTTAANAGVPADKAGLAAALINSSTWVGGALGLAIFSAIATARTNHLLANGTAAPVALTSGFRDALVACGIFLAAAALIAFRARNTRGELPNPVTEEPAERPAEAEAAPTPTRAIGD
jgi:EmrB/QacA subfamily drug resistance transporter